MSKLAHSCDETMEQIERDAREREYRGEATEPIERRSWRCFHCDKVFTDPLDARQHFGAEKCKDADWLLNIRLRAALDRIRHCDKIEDVRIIAAQAINGPTSTGRGD